MIGTMVLVLMGCGSAVFAGSMAGTVGAGVGTVGVALDGRGRQNDRHHRLEQQPL